MAPTLYWEGPPSANPWGGYRHWAEAYPGQDEPDWSLRQPSLHALSQPGGRHAELQHMEYERRVQLGESPVIEPPLPYEDTVYHLQLDANGNVIYDVTKSPIVTQGKKGGGALDLWDAVDQLTALRTF